MKKEITYKQLIVFNGIAAAFIKSNEGKETKLTHSVKNILKQIQKYELLEQYNEKVLNNNLDNCSVDEKTKNILKDADGNLVFTVEKQKVANKANKDIMKELVEINTRITPENDALIKTLSDNEIFAFEGVVITEQLDIIDHQPETSPLT